MIQASSLPPLIQGGMGIGVSNWTLARAVAYCGQLGVVSGTAIDSLLVRRLAAGDPGGHMRRAVQRFPIPGVAERVVQRYFRPDGLAPDDVFPLLPMWRQSVSAEREQVAMLAAFAEVTLAKEGHTSPIGLNLLTKVQMPNLATLYGAMLANVGVVLMGAGIPREIPGVLDALARHERVEIRLDVVDGPPGDTDSMTFDPHTHWTPHTDVVRPLFLPIVSANSLAMTLARKATGRVDGFVVEGPIAGGHNAPPRGGLQLSDLGEPVYSERDNVDFAKMRDLSLPFWIAGGSGSAGALERAVGLGAHGVQVGTLFAFCNESGLDPDLKRRTLAALAADQVHVHTDPAASPTGYPFKLVHVAGDPDEARRNARVRECDLGYLRVAFRKADGRLGYRCAAEPVADYVAKGGTEADTVGRRCLCNGLFANLGLGQRRADGIEPPLLTAGSDLDQLRKLTGGRTSYSAADAVAWVMHGAPARETISNRR